MFKIIKNLPKIISGIKNSWFPTAYVESIAKKRSAICQSNVCGFYDKDGVMEITYLKGKSACGLCGCNERFKTRCLSCACELPQPLWGPEMTEKEEDAFKKKHNISDTE